MNMIKPLIFQFLIVGSFSAAHARVVDFTFDSGLTQHEYYGNNIAQTYDIAIRLDNPLIIGSKIKSLSVDLTDSGVENTSVWLSSDLKLKKINGRGVNDPDICSVPAVVENGKLNVEFDAPYIIPDGGLYVGYSFTVTELNESNSQPVSVVESSDSDGFFLHTSRTKTQWGSMTVSTSKASTISVGLEGDFPLRQMTVRLPSVETFPDENGSGTLSFINTGAEPIESAVLSLEGEMLPELTVEVKCPHPVRFLHNLDEAASFSLPQINYAGTYPIFCHIDKINGEDVMSDSYSGLLIVYPFRPVARPLIDEYTGLWCGFCPKGYVVLENMKKRYGDRFIAAAYHYNDAMAFAGKMPNRVSGYPSAFVNRRSEIQIEDIPVKWDSISNFIPDADIEVSAVWSDETHRSIIVNSDVRFIRSSQGVSYRVSYILIADNLSNTEWQQHNSYAGESVEKYPYLNNQLGRLFLDGDEYVKGLVFNDVALTATDATEPEAFLTSDIAAREVYSHACVFELDEISADLLTQPEQLRVIAVLSKGSENSFVNCNSSAWLNGKPFAQASLKSDHIEETRHEIARFSIDGRLVTRETPGIQIVRYSDGTASKVLVR